MFSNNTMIACDISRDKIIISSINNIVWNNLLIERWWKPCKLCTNRLSGINHKNELVFYQQFTSLVQNQKSDTFQIAGINNIYLYRNDGKCVDLVAGRISEVYVEGKYLAILRETVDNHMLDLYEFND